MRATTKFSVLSVAKDYPSLLLGMLEFAISLHSSEFGR